VASEVRGQRTALQRLDELMGQLVEADQTGKGMDPLRVAQELGRIRALITEAPAVIRAVGGQMHFRCEACGTISHGTAKPQRCPECGGERLFQADLESPDVDAGPA
jgi:rubrerythrin